MIRKLTPPVPRKPRTWFIEWRSGAQYAIAARNLTKAQAEVRLRQARALGRTGTFLAKEIAK